MTQTLEDRLAAYGETLESALSDRPSDLQHFPGAEVATLESVRHRNRLPALAAAAVFLALAGFLSLRLVDTNDGPADSATIPTVINQPPPTFQLEPSVSEAIDDECRTVSIDPAALMGSPVSSVGPAQRSVVVPLSGSRAGVLVLHSDYVHHCDFAIAQDGTSQLLTSSSGTANYALEELQPDGIRTFGGSWGGEVTAWGQLGTGVTDVTIDPSQVSDVMTGTAEGYFFISGTLAGASSGEPIITWKDSAGKQQRATVSELTEPQRTFSSTSREAGTADQRIPTVQARGEYDGEIAACERSIDERVDFFETLESSIAYTVRSEDPTIVALTEPHRQNRLQLVFATEAGFFACAVGRGANETGAALIKGFGIQDILSTPELGAIELFAASGETYGDTDGPGTVALLGRAGSDVIAAELLLSDGTRRPASITEDGWVIATADLPRGVVPLEQRLRWTLSDGETLGGSIQELSDN